MSPLAFALIGLLLFAEAVLLTGVLRRYAEARLLDVPNERSSHSTPTPRGGGLALVATFLLGALAAALWGDMRLTELLALLGGVPVAAIGFLDDHGHVPARWRFLVFVLAAAWAVAWAGGLPPVSLAGHPVDFGGFGDLAVTVLLVWLINLYNFMDGIDGIAGTEAVGVAGGAAVLLFLAGAPGPAQWSLMLVVASLGFLVWNWPPARIFMGDVGSSFVGFVLGVLMLLSLARGLLSLWVWLILLGSFMVDATFTLIRRMLRGERWYEAHRSHAYQHAAQRFGHLRVTLAVAAINLLWLLPMAWAAARWPAAGLLLLAVAYLPLVALVSYLRAGTPPVPEA